MLGPLVTLLALGYPLWVDVTLLSDGHWRARNTLGAAIMLPSFILWAVARDQLGESFTPRVEARSLITRGLYRKLRHPIYVFGAGVALGVVVFVGLPVLALPWLGLIALQVWRARREERALEAAFGDVFMVYRDQTWF